MSNQEAMIDSKVGDKFMVSLMEIDPSFDNLDDDAPNRFEVRVTRLSTGKVERRKSYKLERTAVMGFANMVEEYVSLPRTALPQIQEPSAPVENPYKSHPLYGRF